MPTTELTDPWPEDLAAHLRRLLSDLAAVLESDPHLALSRARKAAKWILADLRREAASGEIEGLAFQELFDRLVAGGLLPRRIQIQFQAIASFGTGEEHSDSGLTQSDVLPCLQALDTVVRWYLVDHLGSSEELTFLPEAVAGSSGVAGTPAVAGSRRRPRRKPAWRLLAHRPHPMLGRLLGVVLSLAVVAVFLLQLQETQIASGRRVGFVFENTDDGARFTSLQPGGPAETGGVQVGDVLLEVAGQPIERVSDYDLPAEDFVRGEPVTFRVRRGGERLDLTIVPGMPVDWMQPAIRGLVMLCCLGLAALTLYRSAGDLRGRLLGIFLFLLAIELAIPDFVIGEPWLQFLLVLFGYLHTGTQIAIELHLASMIPERQRWLARHGWIVPVYYVVSLGWGVVAAVTFVLERLRGTSGLPWSSGQIDGFLSHAGLPLWATTILVLLGIPALAYPHSRGRQQARLVLLGFVPWSLYTYLVSTLGAFGSSLPAWTDPLFPFLILPFPLSIWAMMELESRSHRKILLTLAQNIRQCDTAEEIAQRIAGDLESAFQPACAYVFFRKQGADELTLGHASGAGGELGELPESSELLRLAGRSDEALVHPEDLAGVISGAELDWLERLAARVILPLNDSRRGLVGLVVLGDKRSEEGYSDRDFKLLHSLGGQIALSLENLGLQTRLHEKDRVQREVLARLQAQDVNLVKECPECGACYDSDVEVCGGDGAELSLSVPVERTIAGRYRLERVLGKGGIGAVYEALDQRLNRRVAVKVLLGSVLDKPHVQLRFEREARVIAQLNHPNVVTLYDYGQTTVGNAFIVLELLEGTSLRSVLQGGRPLTPAEVAVWLEPALEGLKAAHRMGVVHRDLKPGNVFLAHGPRGGSRVKLLDFGIAKIKTSGSESGHLTVPGAVLGTLGYMAPEQVFGGGVDERADIYSVGVLVIEALLGRRPFQGRKPLEVLSSVGEGTLELPAGSPAEEALGKILKRCLERDPSDRWPTVAALQEVLIPALLACPGSPRKGGSRPADSDATLAIHPPERTEEI